MAMSRLLSIASNSCSTSDSRKHFGNGLDPINYVVQRIYDMNQAMPDNPIKLIFTTNLSQGEIIARYGVRVQERIWELCDRINLEDTNLRKT